MKIAVIGGGSTYTPELIDGVARMRDELPVEQIVLVDPDADRLAAVGRVSARIMAERGHTTKVSWTSDLDAAVDGASAVLLQLRVGGALRPFRRFGGPLSGPRLRVAQCGQGRGIGRNRTIRQLIGLLRLLRQLPGLILRHLFAGTFQLLGGCLE